MDVLTRTLALGMLVLAACVPALEDHDARVDAERVLAVRAEPAEAAPGQTVTLVALVARADGTVHVTPDLAFCTARRPLGELGPAATACVDGAADALVSVDPPSAIVPRDACRLFGPDVPPSVDGQPPGRPADPDATGGYAIPVRAELDGAVTIFPLRVSCGFAGATRDQSVELTRRSRPNANPATPALSAVDADGTARPLTPDDGSGTPSLVVATGERVTLRVAWPACPDVGVCGDAICGDDEDASACAVDCATKAGCGGAERYVYFDPTTRSVARAREAMRVSFFATDGDFASPRTGIGATDADATGVDDVWTAPALAEDVHAWVVLRDDRGGVSFASYLLRVAP